MSYRAKRKRSKSAGRPKGGRPKGVKGDRLKMTVNELVKQGEQDMERFRNVKKSILGDARSLDRKFLIQKKVLMSMKDRQERIDLKFTELSSEIKESKDELIDVVNKLLKTSMSKDIAKDAFDKLTFDAQDTTKLKELDVQDDILYDLLANKKLLARSTGLKQILLKAKARMDTLDKKREARENRASGKEDEDQMLKEIESDYNEIKVELLRNLKQRFKVFVKKIIIQEEQLKLAKDGVKTSGGKTVKDAIDDIIKWLNKANAGKDTTIFVGAWTQDKMKDPLDTLKKSLTEQNKALKKLRSKFTGSSFSSFDDF